MVRHNNNKHLRRRHQNRASKKRAQHQPMGPLTPQTTDCVQVIFFLVTMGMVSSLLLVFGLLAWYGRTILALLHNARGNVVLVVGLVVVGMLAISGLIVFALIRSWRRRGGR